MFTHIHQCVYNYLMCKKVYEKIEMNNFTLLQQLIMNEILTLEQISDIDTFSLEQKIQQLQQHPYAKFYQQLIAIAKLQLVERYKVQQFGRMLINDEIPVFPDIHIKSEVQITTQNNNKIAKSKKKIDFAECLKRSLVPDEEQLVIGRPVLGNYRYIAKPPINNVKQRKKNVIQTRKSTNSNYKKSYEKNARILPKIGTNSSLKCQKSEPRQQEDGKQKKQQHIQNCNSSEIQQQFKLIIKNEQMNVIPAEQKKLDMIKSESKIKQGIKIKYIENDVYEGEKLLLDTPLKLAELKIEEDEVNQSIMEELEHQDTSVEQMSIENQKEQPKQIQTIDCKVEQNCSQKIVKQPQQQINISQIDQQKSIKVLNSQQEEPAYGLQFQYHNQPWKKQSQQQGKESAVVEDRKYETLQISKPEKKEPVKLRIGQNKVRSISYSTNISKSSRTIGVHSANQDLSSQADNISITPAIDLQLEKNEMNDKTKIDNKTMANFTKPKKLSLLQNNKRNIVSIERPILQTFNYQQIIPSFNKLFPHSSSLINDLRSIQKQLHDHLDKKINDLSRTDQYLRIRQNQLLFKVVSESEKAKKFTHFFDIDLESYMQKSKIMIDRIKKVQKHSKEEDLLLYRVVRQKQDVYDIISNTFHRSQNWYELPHGMDLKMSWNLLWTWSKPQIDIKELFYFQKVNHFFGNKEIARKDLLKKNIERIKKLGPKAKQSFDIIPQTYYLPGQNMQFVRKFRQCTIKSGLNYWIMKPVGLSRGRGIQLVTKIEDIVFSEPVVVQKYLENPLLLEGYKFDMRIYVLVTSINPLEAFVYKQGFARISTERYSLEDEDVHNKFIHLTNFSVQKQNFQLQNHKPKQNFALSSLQKELGGCKITLRCLKQKLKQQGIQWQTIQSQIDSIVLKSLISTMNVIQPNPNCFQLFGYDIIIDDNLKCWLIEVNSSPSLQKDFTIDEIVKQQLVDDIISIVDPIPYDRQRLLEVVTRRRKELEGLKSHINTQNNSNSQLNSDLHYILHGRPLRKYGQKVDNNNFRRVAPGQTYQNIIKTVQQYKLTSITKQEVTK